MSRFHMNIRAVVGKHARMHAFGWHLSTLHNYKAPQTAAFHPCNITSLSRKHAVTCKANLHHPRCASMVQGGMPGAERLRDSAPLNALVTAQQESGRLLGAICATPAVFLEAKGYIKPGVKATAHPAFADKMKEQRCACF